MTCGEEGEWLSLLWGSAFKNFLKRAATGRPKIKKLQLKKRIRMKKVALLLVVGFSLIFSTSLVWGH